MLSQVKVAEQSRYTARQTPGTPHLKFDRLAQPDNVPTDQKSSPEPNVYALNPLRIQDKPRR